MKEVCPGLRQSRLTRTLAYALATPEPVAWEENDGTQG
jgi:hypothetical protein